MSVGRMPCACRPCAIAPAIVAAVAASCENARVPMTVLAGLV